VITTLSQVATFLFVVWLASSSSSFGAVTCDGAIQTEYEPVVIELQGTLDRQFRYGPPGYGENPDRDQRVLIPILWLDCPVSVSGNRDGDLNTEDVLRITGIQLNIPAKLKGWDALIGHSVKVRGTLSHAMTGHHYTAAVLAVSRIIAGSAK